MWCMWLLIVLCLIVLCSINSRDSNKEHCTFAMSFPHLLCCLFLTQQECGSNSILIKYFLEAKNHLPPQRRAHCYVPLLRSISWWCGDINIFWSIRCIAWLYLDELGTLEASYQICMPGISAQINLERPSQTVFSECICYILRNHPTVIYSVPPWQKSGNTLLRPSLQSQNSELRTFQTCPTKSSW